MPQTPQHPAIQQGLGAPQGQSPQNTYYQPNVGLQAAQAQQADAQASKAMAERDVLAAQAQRMQQANQAPENPMVTHARQLADAMINQGVPASDIFGSLLRQGASEDEAVEITGLATQMADEANASRAAEVQGLNQIQGTPQPVPTGLGQLQ